jgi:hypothetical protein
MWESGERRPRAELAGRLYDTLIDLHRINLVGGAVDA